jgi:hypothetical protein
MKFHNLALNELKQTVHVAQKTRQKVHIDYRHISNIIRTQVAPRNAALLPPPA